MKGVRLLVLKAVFLLGSGFSFAADEASQIPEVLVKGMVAMLEQFLRSQAWRLGICSP